MPAKYGFSPGNRFAARLAQLQARRNAKLYKPAPVCRPSWLLPYLETRARYDANTLIGLAQKCAPAFGRKASTDLMVAAMCSWRVEQFIDRAVRNAKEAASWAYVILGRDDAR